MSEQSLVGRQASLEERSRALFQDSVERIDMRTRSRLTQGRHAALEAAERARPRRAWFKRMPVLTSTAGVAAAMVLGVSLWLHTPVPHHGAMSADNAANFEDLDIVAAGDNSQDNVEMLQDDLDFYAWADKTAGPEPSA